MRPNNRPNIMNNESMRASYRPMRVFCKYMRYNIKCNFDHLALHTGTIMKPQHYVHANPNHKFFYTSIRTNSLD